MWGSHCKPNLGLRIRKVRANTKNFSAPPVQRRKFDSLKSCAFESAEFRQKLTMTIIRDTDSEFRRISENYRPGVIKKLASAPFRFFIELKWLWFIVNELFFYGTEIIVKSV